MIDQIKKCNKCGLCKNQLPLLDKKNKCQIIWVGLSAKKIKCDSEIPLSTNTNTGMLISNIEEAIGELSSYRTNLVKCLPLNEFDKLRYPTREEINSCIGNLILEIDELSPRIVFLLGEKVYKSIGKFMDIEFEKWSGFDYSFRENNGVYYVPVQHPSYIYVYKRKQINQYVKGIEYTVKKIMELSRD